MSSATNRTSFAATHLVGGVCRAAEGYKESKTGLYRTCGPLLASGVVLGTLFTWTPSMTCTVPFLLLLVVSIGAMLASFHQEESQSVVVYLVANLHTGGWSINGHLFHVACLVHF